MTNMNLHIQLPEPLIAQLEGQAIGNGYPTVSALVSDIIAYSMENQKDSLTALRAHLAEGEAEIEKGKGVENFCVEEFLEEERKIKSTKK